MSMVSNPLRALWPLALALSLAACGSEPAPVEVRPALVVQASSGELGYEALAGEVHAREEPQLAFRIAGKISRRLVDAGARVAAGQALAELDRKHLATGVADSVRLELRDIYQTAGSAERASYRLENWVN